MQAVIHHLFWNRSCDCSVYTTSKDGVLRVQTWFSCSVYSFHSEQAEQKSSPLEHLCWRTPEYSVFRGGADRTVTWPVPKKMADHCLHARKYFVSLHLFRSTPKCPVLLVYVARVLLKLLNQVLPGIRQHRCSSALDFCSACSEWKE